jgi:hypothetical protein
LSKGRSYPGWQIFILLLVLGGIIGGWIGDATQSLWPTAKLWASSRSVGIPNFSLDLGVIDFSFGLMMHLNLFTIIGFIAAYVVFETFA